MFLTTNRPRTTNAASNSRLDRIDLYPYLNLEARKAVWITFIEKHATGLCRCTSRILIMMSW